LDGLNPNRSLKGNANKAERGVAPGFRRGDGWGWVSVIPVKAGIYPNFFHLNRTPEINPSITLTNLNHNTLP